MVVLFAFLHIAHLHFSIDVMMYGDIRVYDSFRVYSTNKDAVIITDNYGERALHCYEMPDAKFMDEGVAELENGLCRIDIDPIFLETIEPNTPETPFIVHLTAYDWPNLRVKEVGDSYFIIEEKEGLNGIFSWQLSAIRKGGKDLRLERVDDDSILTSNWEDDFIESENQSI